MIIRTKVGRTLKGHSGSRTMKIVMNAKNVFAKHVSQMREKDKCGDLLNQCHLTEEITLYERKRISYFRHCTFIHVGVFLDERYRERKFMVL